MHFFPNIGTYFQIASFLNNKFGKRLQSDEEFSSEIIERMKETKRDLKILFSGTYQLSQAVSYLAGMIDEDGQIRLQYVKKQSSVLKLEVQSSHISKKVYWCFVKYELNTISISVLLEYTCHCANGSRTVGCCSHIAAIIYYLAHARYL